MGRHLGKERIQPNENTVMMAKFNLGSKIMQV